MRSGDRRGRRRAEALSSLDATRLATALMGDAIATNLFMLGYAYQKGLVPLREPRPRARDRAERRRGRDRTSRASSGAGAPPSIWRASRRPRAGRADAAIADACRASLDELIARRVELPDRLPGRRLRRSATRALVDGCARPRARGRRASTGLTEAVARYYFKLLAYKDEYEVARLYTDGEFLKQLARPVRGRLQAGLPPGAAACCARSIRRTGEPKKSAYRAVDAEGVRRCWPRLKRLRGTPARPLRPHRRAEDGAPADRRLREDAG